MASSIVAGVGPPTTVGDPSPSAVCGPSSATKNPRSGTCSRDEGSSWYHPGFAPASRPTPRWPSAQDTCLMHISARPVTGTSGEVYLPGEPTIICHQPDDESTPTG